MLALHHNLCSHTVSQTKHICCHDQPGIGANAAAHILRQYDVHQQQQRMDLRLLSKLNDTPRVTCYSTAMYRQCHCLIRIKTSKQVDHVKRVLRGIMYRRSGS